MIEATTPLGRHLCQRLEVAQYLHSTHSTSTRQMFSSFLVEVLTNPLRKRRPLPHIHHFAAVAYLHIAKPRSFLKKNTHKKNTPCTRIS
jgi:hypothetical protein